MKISDEIVEAAAEEVWPEGASLEQHARMRRGLQAAFQHLPFADIPLSLNAEAVKAAIRSVVFSEFGTFGGSVDRATDAVMSLIAAPAAPQPPDRRISPAVLADTIQAMMCGTVNRDASVERSDCENTAEVIIDSFVACGFLAAVPQPVDREALRAAIKRHLPSNLEGAARANGITNAVLTLLGGSVLAGEQEQVAPE